MQKRCMSMNRLKKDIKKVIIQFTKVSNLDESDCLYEENECPPIIDKSTIERPQSEVLYLLLVYLRFDLPKCHP